MRSLSPIRGKHAARSMYTADKYRRPEHIACGWGQLRAQLILQWSRLKSGELDEAGPDRHQIALLIQRKYGIASPLVENYLKNVERTLPV